MLAGEQELNGEVHVPRIGLDTLAPEQVSVLPFANSAAFGLPTVEGVKLGIGQLVALAQKLVAGHIRSTRCLGYAAQFGGDGLELNTVLLSVM